MDIGTVFNNPGTEKIKFAFVSGCTICWAVKLNDNSFVLFSRLDFNLYYGA